MTRRRTGAAEAKSRTPAGAGQPSLPLPNRKLLERLGQIAHRLGTRSFLVGGPVRDLLLRTGEARWQKQDVRSQKSSDPVGLPDIDIAVEEGSREFGAAVAKEFGGHFVFHSRFLTGTVSFPKPQP